MARFFFLIATLISSISALANDKLDLASQHKLRCHNINIHNKINSQEPKFYPSIIKIDENQSVDELETLGVKIMHRRDNLLLAFIPIDKIDQLLALSCVSRMSLSNHATPVMDKARPFCNLQNILEPSTEFPSGWNGSGVVVGFSDIGFDPHHPNFTGSDGSTRVKKLVNYVDMQGLVNDMSTPAEIAAWETDDPTEWHATHVAGILTGNYKENGYQGVASEADIVGTTSALSDACILAGAEEVIDYAKSTGKPAVINLSVGSYIGPHDGTTLFNQYLDKLGNEAIICMAAGNEGRKTNTLQLQFDDQFQSTSTYIRDCINWTNQRVYGEADFWSADATPFEVCMAIYDLTTKAKVKEYPFIGKGDNTTWIIASDNYDDGSVVTDATFNSCFDGYFSMSCGIDPENGRFRVYSSFDVTNRSTIDLIGRYFITVTIKGDLGTQVNAYSDGIHCYFNSGGLKDFVTGNSRMSISDIACGHNVIVVGASSSRNTAPLLDGSTQRYGFDTDNIAEFSGYGTLADGRTLPHFSAPGNYIISSCSTPYVERNKALINFLSAKADVNGKEAYWISECGTSMASPLVAGIIALWLQADPDLTVEEARDIAIKTAQTSYEDITDPRWGAGNIDALAGLRMVIENSGISSICQDAQTPIIIDNGNEINITLPSFEGEFIATLHSIDGKAVSSSQSIDRSATINISTITHGYYILSTSKGSKPRVIRL